MFKLVVLSALLAAAVASPGAIIAPLAYTSTIVSPATTSIVNQASSVIHPSPLLYSRPTVYSAIPTYAHLIKKRSAPLALSPYVAPTTYIAPAPLTTTYSAALPWAPAFAAPIATPIVRTSPLIATAHLIKKRSAPLIVPSTYITRTHYAATPLVSTYAATSPIVSSPVISYSSPIIYNHLIKKRSLAIPVSTYIAPSAYSQTSRVDIHTSPAVSTTYTTLGAPIAYSGLTHLI